jgi:hypothetical protein
MVLIPGDDRSFLPLSSSLLPSPLFSSYNYHFLIPLHIPLPPESGVLFNDFYNTGW